MDHRKFIDYYKILGADRYDDYNKIREARNERLKQYNSDRGNIAMGEAEKQLRDTAMKEINAAWEILGDEEKREKYNEEEYDKRFATPPRGASPNPPPGRSYQQHYTPPNPPPFTPPPPPPRTPPGGAYQQHYAPPNPPPQTPPRWGYGQSYAPTMAPAAKAKHKRNKRMLVVGGIGGGAAIGGVEIGIFAAEVAAFGGGAIERLILGAILGALTGAVLGAVASAISLAVIRILAGKEALAFSGGKEAVIVIIVGIVAGAATPLRGSFAIYAQFAVAAIYAQFAVAVVAGVVAGAVVAGIVRKKSSFSSKSS